MARQLSFHPSKKHSDWERWICVYPAYINSKKTKAEGRIIAKEKCVENPTYEEILDVLIAHNIKFLFENKQYSRERSKELPFRGRIRVHLKNDDGTPLNSEYATRDSILLLLGDMIPKLKSRARKQTTGEQPQQKNPGNQKKDKGKGKRR